MPSKRFKMGHRRSADREESVKMSDNPSTSNQKIIYTPFAGMWNANSSLEKQLIKDECDPDATLHAFGEHVYQMPCGLCRTLLLPNYQCASELSQKLLDNKASGYLPCRECGAHTCVGCGMVPRGRRSGEIGSCCDNARLFSIWLWLCALETMHTEDTDPKPSPPDPRRRSPGLRDRFHGYQARETNGTGYGGHNSYAHGMLSDDTDDSTSESPSISPKDRNPRKGLTGPSKYEREQILSPNMFAALCDLMPDFTRATTFDKTPPALLVTMLRRSQVLETVATLMRTDSFDDVVARFHTYALALEFLLKIIQHPHLITLVAGSRELHSVEAGRGLLRSTLGSQPNNPTSRPCKAESVTSLSELLFRFRHAAQKIQKQVHKAADDFENQEGQHLLHICSKIETLCQVLQTNTQAIGIHLSEGSENTLAGDTRPHKMARWHRETCVEAVDDDLFKHDFHYTKDRLRKDQPPKGRMKRLLTELAPLQASLPEGIFVRYASSRPDLMRILIIGPRDTPYEQGLFEFDLVCPLEYPRHPPSMHFRTTGKGRAHFNPNLYPDGKVCLSLLGTWSGPSWVPNESTILQILVSIQAMIFCAEPWYNEPGRETRQMEEASQRYNVDMQSLTVSYALTEPLRAITKRRKSKQKTQRQHVWTDIVEKHFSVYGSEISEKLKDWQKKAEKLPARSMRRRDFMPPPPQGSFHPGLPPGPGFAPPFGPPGSWSQLSTSPVDYAPHPYYGNNPDSLIVDMSCKFTKLANDLQSQLVHCAPPSPGEGPGEGGNQLKFVIDPIVPDQFRDEILNAAEHIGFPLVVPKSPFITHGVAGGPSTAEMYKQFTSPPPPMFTPSSFGSKWSSGSPGPSSPFELIKQKIKQKSLSTLAASTKVNGPKSYSSALASAPMLPPKLLTEEQKAAREALIDGLLSGDLHKLAGYIPKNDSVTPAKLGQATASSPGQMAAPSANPSGVDWQPPQKPKPADPTVGSHGWDINKVLDAAPKLDSSAEELMPPLAPIPEVLLGFPAATALTLFLRTIIFDVESLKNTSSASWTQANLAFATMRQQELIDQANTNKAGRKYTLEEFTEEYAKSWLMTGQFEDDDDDDDDDDIHVPIYEPHQPKPSFGKLIEEYDAALKEFLDEIQPK